jgi:hypothetical protein
MKLWMLYCKTCVLMKLWMLLWWRAGLLACMA